MKLTGFPAAAVAGIALLAVCWLTFGLPDKSSPEDSYFFEATLSVDSGRDLQLFYDRGRGYSEADSVHSTIEPGPVRQTCRFALPFGTFRSFRLDLASGPVRATIAKLRVIAPDGSPVLDFPPDRYATIHQVASQVRDPDGLHVILGRRRERPLHRLPDSTSGHARTIA